MSTYVESDYTRQLRRKLVWDETRSAAAKLLAVGYNKQYVADEVGVSRMTIWHWLNDPEFASEVDRLSTMVDVAGRAERLRDAMRVLRSKRDEQGVLKTDKDALDWLKYLQSETDGVRIDLSKLTELTGEEQSSSSAIDVEASHQPQLSEPTEPLAPQDVVGPTATDNNGLLDQPTLPADND